MSCEPRVFVFSSPDVYAARKGTFFLLLLLFFSDKEKRFTYIDTLATLAITLLSHVILDMLFIYSFIDLFCSMIDTGRAFKACGNGTQKDRQRFKDTRIEGRQW